MSDDITVYGNPVVEPTHPDTIVLGLGDVLWFYVKAPAQTGPTPLPTPSPTPSGN
jgi:hypothetical protein